MTPLTEILMRRITRMGPITIADYMTECLLHPQHGYYATRDPLGAKGDFTTAPEISQMFGEMIGLWLVQVWMTQGAPSQFILAELGPGRGTLMADILRTARAVPEFSAAAQVYLVEASPTLRAVQAKTLPDVAGWCDTVADLPEGPLFLIANEFFDALPIRQFQRDAKGWRERQVAVIDDALAFGLSAPAPISLLDHRLDDTEIGQLVEHCPQAAPISQEIARRIAAHGGAALMVDYGDWHSRGDTLQAVRAHSYGDPLAHPGEADLTAHVDFEALAQAATGVHTTELTPQGVFLERLGITERAQALAKIQSGAALENHIAAHRRLTHPQEMGTLFKTLAFVPDDAPMPPGFAP